MRLHRLFVALAFIVPSNTITHQVGHELEEALIALLGLGELLDDLNDVVLALAHEVLEEHLVTGSAPGLACPIDLLNRRQRRKVGFHVWLQKVRFLLGT